MPHLHQQILTELEGQGESAVEVTTSATFRGAHWYAEATCPICLAEIAFRHCESVNSPVGVETICGHAVEYAHRDGNLVVFFKANKPC